MDNRIMKSRLSSHSSNRGFTLLELLVTTFFGLLISGLVAGSVLTNRHVLARDMVRTRLTQNLRGALDIIALDARIGGQSLGASFPAIEVADNGQRDTLTIRRGLIDEILPLCQAITAGSGGGKAFFAVPGTVQGCSYTGQTHNYSAWRTYRISQGGVVDAYIYDSAAKKGEFFKYTSESDSGTKYNIQRSGSWSNSYPIASTAIYILEEWEFSLNGEMLQLVQNKDTANPQNVSFSMDSFSVNVAMQDGSTTSSFTKDDPWTQIGGISVTLAGHDTFSKQNVNRSLTAMFFPRNILSN